MSEERLQKILAHAGVASRRKAEELITAGRVSVNGKTITELGSKADLSIDRVKVDGRLLSEPKHHLYFALNKPKNCVSTVHDPEGRQTVMSFFKGFNERLYPVGRLDYASEGLLLLTNDGDFANKLMSPASHVTKTYLAKVTGALSTEQEEEFRRGIPMHGRRTAPAGLTLVRKAVNPWYEVRLVEGRQNQIRIMFKHFGRLVEKLKRVKIGFLDLGTLKPGAYRTLTNAEVARFQKLLDSAKGEAARPQSVKDYARPSGGAPDTEPVLRGVRDSAKGEVLRPPPAKEYAKASGSAPDTKPAYRGARDNAKGEAARSQSGEGGRRPSRSGLESRPAFRGSREFRGSPSKRADSAKPSSNRGGSQKQTSYNSARSKPPKRSKKDSK